MKKISPKFAGAFPLILITGLFFFLLRAPVLSSDAPIEAGKKASPFLTAFKHGFFLASPINNKFVRAFDVSVKEGLLVTGVDTSQAVQPWPQMWDIIIKCNDLPVREMDDLFQAVQSPLRLVLYRRGEFVDLEIPLGEKPGESRPSQKSSAKEEEKIVFLYHMQGEPRRNDKFSLLGDGTGRMTGNVMIAGKPAVDMDVSLILDGNRRTQPVAVTPDGTFEARVPAGSYYYLGYVLSGNLLPLRDMVSMDRHLPNEVRTFKKRPAKDGDKVMERFVELSKQYGDEEAAHLLAKEFERDYANAERERAYAHGQNYPLDVTINSPAAVPPIVYVQPIQVLEPLPHTTASVNDLQFKWTPCEGAKYYVMEILYMKKQDTVSFVYKIASNKVFQTELAACRIQYLERPSLGTRERELKPGEKYAVQVFAYDKEDRLISVSSERQVGTFSIK